MTSLVPLGLLVLYFVSAVWPSNANNRGDRK